MNNALAVGGLYALNFAAMLIVVKFLAMHLVVMLRNHPAGAGLAALML